MSVNFKFPANCSEGKEDAATTTTTTNQVTTKQMMNNERNMAPLATGATLLLF